MSQYLLSFAKKNLEAKSNAYLILLGSAYKSSLCSGRISDSIKEIIASQGDAIALKNYQAIASKIKRILSAKPELDWVAPSGLNPLTGMHVKNFRGFGALDHNDNGTFLKLGKVKNIFYAPNGGGKTSLCEALEFGVTGHIKEADRRKTKIRKYIMRGNTKHVLKLFDNSKLDVKSSLKWSSCFIDRNRLQEFSLLGSKDTGSQEKDVLATLFGLEEYQNLISRFVLPASFNLSHLKRPALKESMQSIAEEQVRVRERIIVQRAINYEQGAIACKALGLKLSDIGAIRIRVSFLKKLIAKKTSRSNSLKTATKPRYVSERSLRAFIRLTLKWLKIKDEIEKKYIENISSVNYKAIYEAITFIATLEDKPDYCPACLTALSDVKENPFSRASAEIEQLKYLDKLKNTNDINNHRLNTACKFIADIVEAVKFNTGAGIENPFEFTLLSQLLNDYLTASDRPLAASLLIREYVKNYESYNELVLSYLSACMAKDNQIALATDNISKIDFELNLLNEKIETFAKCVDLKKAAIYSMKAEGQNLKRLNERLLILRSTNIKDGDFNQLLDEIVAEYKNLYEDLQGFKLDLEQERLVGIEEKATGYYQAINNHDDEHEKIEALKFIKSADGYRIEISNQLGDSVDAFAVLSEGHLRVLGLSILLAMAERSKLPLIVFDDVVNAIDSDHRSNIIDLLFSDNYLRKVQMIVTTHDRLFWERFCLTSERDTYADQNLSYVLRYTNKGIVFIDYAGGFRKKIEFALSMYDIRQALIYCRIWFESIAFEFCIEKQIVVTAKFTKANHIKKINHLQISLEKTFGLLEPYLEYDKSNFNLIKKDLINWSGQNQEHHTFDEFGLNFIHSKTSNEVIRIYDAIRLLECQLLPEGKKISCNDRLVDLLALLTKGQKKLDALEKAPTEIQQDTKNRISRIKSEVSQIEEELAYIETCEQALKDFNSL